MYQPWSAANDQKMACAKSLFGPSPTGPVGGVYTASTVAFTFPPMAWQVNWQPTLISLGKDKKPDSSFGQLADPKFLQNYQSTGLFLVNDDGDDILGYRLRREGNSGN